MDVFGVASVPLPDAAEAAAADRSAREDHGMPAPVLMENAGRAAALVLQRTFPDGPVVVLAGSGNNGGDAVVVARTLHAWGRDVTLITAGSRAPDPALFHGAELHSADDADSLQRAAVIVDGMLGTGSTGAPRGEIATWVKRVCDVARPVLALDLPSGVDASSGAVPGIAVLAAVTVSFGWPKLGLMLHPARRQCGRLVAVDIGFPPALPASRGAAITSGWFAERLRPRDPQAHKSSAGRLCILAGSTGMAGAAVLSAVAAFRTGAGLVRIASPASNRVVVQSAVPEATFMDATALDEGDLSSMHALLAGPGMGTSEEARAALERALSLTGARPVLLDADALNMLAREPDTLHELAQRRPVLITPHVRELGRLLDAPEAELLADMPAAARRAAQRFGCAVLFKGQPSIVATPDGNLLVNTVGSSDTATAGMGDQLAGSIGAFLAAGHPPAEAAALALYACGRAADLAGFGRSLMPGDVSRHLPRALRSPGPAASSLDLPFVTFDQPPRW